MSIPEYEDLDHQIVSVLKLANKEGPRFDTTVELERSGWLNVRYDRYPEEEIQFTPEEVPQLLEFLKTVTKRP